MMLNFHLLSALFFSMLHSSLLSHQNSPITGTPAKKHCFGLFGMSILLTLLLNYQMYNSEEVYTFEQNKQTQSHVPSTDEQKNGRLNKSRPKNGLILGHKANGISGTYARIVPKKPIHDMQRLYAQNMQLRQKIRSLEEDGTKIKTRMQMAEKQKQQLISHLCNSQYGNSVLKDRRPSQKGLVKTQDKTSKLGLDQNRRILHGYKDQIDKLKLQNGRLKKTVKYTQIQQLETQNQLLHEEMARMKQYMKQVIENTEYDDYEKQIERLNNQLQGQRDAKKSVFLQLKKKDEEMQQIKNKMKIIANRKTQLEKKYNREMGNVKGELHRAKEREKQYFVLNNQKKELSKPKITQKPVECKSCVVLKQHLQSQKKKLTEMELSLRNKQKQIHEMENKLKQSELKNEKASEKSPAKDEHKKGEVHEKNGVSSKQKQSGKKQQIKGNSEKFILQEKNRISQSKQNEAKQNENKQLAQSKDFEDSYDEQDDDEEDLDFEAQDDKNGDQSEDKVDVLHVNLGKQKNQDPNKSRENKQQNGKKYSEGDQKYSQSFNKSSKKKGEDSQEEVLFQKQQKSKQKKEKVEKKKQEGMPKQKQEGLGKQKVSGTKAQKILKQTIKYRLMAQRYCYKDFHRDIKDSGSTDFTVQQLISMLTNQPFFLSEDHLKMVLFSLFEKQELDESDATTTVAFLKKMKILIGDFEIRDEKQQQILLKSIQTKLSKKKPLQKMKQQAKGKQISKKGFVKVLKQSVNLNDDEIEQCLAEASVISVDIAHINYVEFLQKLTQS